VKTYFQNSFAGRFSGKFANRLTFGEVMGKSTLIFLTHGVDDRWCYTVSENIHALWIALSFAVDASSVMSGWKYSIF